MQRRRMSKADLEEENTMLRDRLGEARELIDEALGVEEVDEDDDEEEIEFKRAHD